MEQNRRALFVYESEAEHLIEKVRANKVDCEIALAFFDDFCENPSEFLSDIKHVVVSASLPGIKKVLRLSMTHGFAVGIVPMEGQKRLASYLDLPGRDSKAIALALEPDPKPMDIVTCNGEILLFRGVIGTLPVLDSPEELSRLGMFIRASRRYGRLRLRPFKIVTANEKEVDTGASGCMIVQRHEGDIVSRLTRQEISVRDGGVGVVVASPFSVVEYLKFIIQLFFPSRVKRGLPPAVGYVKSSELHIETRPLMDVFVDGAKAGQTPVKCEVIPSATCVNLGPALMEEDPVSGPAKETIRVDHLRKEKELGKSIGKRIPFFSYATEDRFKDLFTALHEDAQINNSYLVFMVLSTLLATVGLYLNSAAVIIGAMILAPLMAPLVSISMGVLRANNSLFWNAFEKTMVGVVIALLSAALASMLFPYKAITPEMLGRLNPTLPDLFVAIFSGIAAAYARSYKEIAQNLAGVAIAVALVPPLAVAGIGIGRGDLHFFLQAFLLFSTNLVGIVLAATLTFRVLGYSPMVRSKRGVGVFVLLLAMITVPLSLSSGQIVERVSIESRLETDRFLVNGKYIIVRDVDVSYRKGQLIMMMSILAREPLDRADLSLLKRKLQGQSEQELVIKTEIAYML